MRALLMRLALCAAVLACGVRADGDPWDFRGGLGDPPRAAKSIEVRLADGRLRIRRESTWASVTLDELAVHLRNAVPKSAKTSKPWLVVRVANDTPWEHVCWTAVVATEYRITNLHLRTGDAAVGITFPPDSSRTFPPVEARDAVRVGVGRFARRLVDGEAAADRADFRRRLKRLIHAKTRGERKPADLIAVPSFAADAAGGDCVDVLRILDDLGLAKADLGRLIRIPSKEIRRKNPLPSPRR